MAEESEQGVEVIDVPEEVTQGGWIVVEVHSIKATDEVDCLIFDLTYTNPIGDTERSDVHVYRPGSAYGLNPSLEQWLLDNPDTPIIPYVPPTPEEIRANMRPLGRLEFKTKFKAAGMNATKINAYLASLEDDVDLQEDMQMYYDETIEFGRLSAFVLGLATFSLKTPEQIDAIWTA